MSGNYPPDQPSGDGNGFGSEPRGPQYAGPGQGGPAAGPQGPGGPASYPGHPASGTTPSGPPPGGGFGAPTGPQQPYGAPQQPYGAPQQPYGAPQQPYGAPAQPYPGYGGGPQGPGQPPLPPGQQPKKGFPKVLIIVGIVVLALIAAGITGGILLTRAARTAGTGPTNDPNQSSAPPAATKPSDAVRGYLEALAAGNPEAALALGDTTPADTTFLTKEVLAASAELAPITDINVPEVDDEYAYQVAASFKLGKQAVNENFSVTKAGDQWKLRDAVNEIDLSFRSSKNLPTIINGVQAKSSKIRLFPGAYKFTTGSDYVNWGEENVLLIQSPSEYPRGLSDLRATLTDEGTKAFSKAVSDSLDNCLKSNKISNPGCPNNVTKVNSTYKFKDGTLKWEATTRERAFEDMQPRIDYSNPSIASAYISLGLQAEGQCDAPGGTCTLTPYRSLQPRANMLQQPLKVSWFS